MTQENSPENNPFGIPSSGPTNPVPAEQSRGSGNNSFAIIAIVLGTALTILLVCGGVLVALLIPAVSAARKAAQTMSRSNQVKQIGLGIHNYHSAYRQLPFTATENTAGEERLGWRVAISPFVEGQSQWERYDNLYAWNDLINEPLSIDAPFAFQASSGSPGETSLVVIVDPNGMFPPTPNVRVGFQDVTDGLSNTLMAMELPDDAVIWTSNENVSADEAFAAIKSMQPDEFTHLLMADGSVRRIRNDLDRNEFDAMVTIAGGEKIPTSTPHEPDFDE